MGGQLYSIVTGSVPYGLIHLIVTMSSGQEIENSLLYPEEVRFVARMKYDITGLLDQLKCKKKAIKGRKGRTL